MHPKALTGMMIGSSIMYVFAMLWFLLGLSGGRFFPLEMKVAVAIVGLALGAAIAVLAVRAHRISRGAPAPTAEQLETGRKASRRFGLINGIQWGAVVAVIVALNVVGRPDFIAPAIAVIVGLHFLPLAGLFEQPVYYVTGILGCLIGVAGFLIPDLAGSSERSRAVVWIVALAYCNDRALERVRFYPWTIRYGSISVAFSEDLALGLKPRLR